MITIRAFKAVDEPKTCYRFLEGHVKVLEDFGLENISTNTPKWINHDGTYVIIAEYQGALLGGARLQIADNKYLLPVVEAVAHFDSKIYGLVADKKDDGGACELCGLWNARILPPNLGLTRKISVAAVSLVTKINVKNIFAICAGYTLYPAMRMGMVIQKSVGKNGEFIYPNSNFRARVLCMNGFTLETSTPEFREDILKFRKNPLFQEPIIIDNVEVPIEYDLSLNLLNQLI